MTIPELIAEVLQSLRNQFYNGSHGWGIREFKRDEARLIRAISLYGHLCFQRGWEFDVAFILGDLMKIIQSFKISGVQIDFMPVYLTGAIKRSIGLRADELNAKAKSMRTKNGTTKRERLQAPAIPAARLVNDVVAGKTAVVAVREKSATETLADVYAALRKARPARKPAPAPTVKQPSLL